MKHCLLNDYPLFGLGIDCSSPLLGVFTNNDHAGLTMRWKPASRQTGFVGENTKKGE